MNPSANHPVTVSGDISGKGRKVVVSRQLLVSGQIVFIVGTEFGGVVNRDSTEVPLTKILDHVTPAELQRFENLDFLEEDIREANLPPPKARGRPVGSRLVDGKLVRASVSAVPLRDRKPHSQPTKPVVVLQNASRSPTQDFVRAPSSRTPQIAVRVRGSNAPHAFTVRVPSFNGPQPGQRRQAAETDTSSESSEDELSSQKPTRRHQYAMAAASGLAPPETSPEETSREVSISRAPSPERSHFHERGRSPKRRRLDVQLPLRATSPSLQLDGNHATPKAYQDRETVFDKMFRQSMPSVPMTETDRIVYESLRDHSNSLPPLWPTSHPTNVTTQKAQSPPSTITFPPNFDRGRYPAQRRRRGNKHYTPARKQGFVPSNLSKTVGPETQQSPNSLAQSEVEDADMVNMLDVRDEEAEREALLRQFHPTDILQNIRASSLQDIPRPGTATPPRKIIASPPLSAEKASELARGILNKINGQSQHAQPASAPSIQVTTPGKSIQKRTSLTPHFPHNVDSSSEKRGKPSHYRLSISYSPSKIAKPAREIVYSATKGRPSPGPTKSSKTESAKSNSNSPISPVNTNSTVPSSSKSPHSSNTKLTVFAKNNINSHPDLSLPTNRALNQPKPKSLTDYFRPKFSPVQASPTPPPASEEENESEDPLTRASSYDSLNPNSLLVQRRSQHTTPDPAPTPTQNHNNTDSDSLKSEVLLVQRRSQRTTPTRILKSGHRGQGASDAIEVPDSADEESSEASVMEVDEEDEREEPRHGSKQLTSHVRPAQILRSSVEADNEDRSEEEEEEEEEREVVDVSSDESTDSLSSEVLLVQSRRA